MELEIEMEMEIVMEMEIGGSILLTHTSFTLTLIHDGRVCVPMCIICVLAAASTDTCQSGVLHI